MQSNQHRTDLEDTEFDDSELLNPGAWHLILRCMTLWSPYHFHHRRRNNCLRSTNLEVAAHDMALLLGTNYESSSEDDNFTQTPKANHVGSLVAAPDVSLEVWSLFNHQN